MKYSKLTLILTSLLLLAAGVFTACSDFDDMEVSTEELYTREFIKQFGVFDSNHNWNLATESSITLSPQSFVNEAKVYARYDGKYYYVARAINCYKDVTLNFDVPSGVTDLKVVVDGTTYYAQAGTKILVGGGNSSRSVDISGERIVHENDGKVSVNLHDEDDPLIFNAQQLLPIFSSNNSSSSHYKWEYYDKYGTFHSGTGGYVPEGEVNLDNTSKITQDFMFRKKEEIATIYPIFWNSSQTLTLGLYYFWETDNEGNPVEGGQNKDGRTDENDLTTYNPNYLHKIPIYTDKDLGADRQISREKPDAEKTVTYTGQCNYAAHGTLNWPIINTLIEKYNTANNTTYDIDHIFTFKSVTYNGNTFDLVTGFNQSFITELNDIFYTQIDGTSAISSKSRCSGISTVTLRDASSFTWASEDTPYCEFDVTITYIDQDNQWTDLYDGTERNKLIKDWFSTQGSAAYDFTIPNVIKSRGIDITIPEGLNVGMYITGGNFSDVLYSQSSRNTTWGTYNYEDNGTTKTSDKFYSFAATFDHDEFYIQSGASRDGETVKLKFFCFEDWTGSGSDADLNDIMFGINGVQAVTTSTIIKEEKQQDEQFQWIIAAEDLGTTDDFDFNDMVAGISILPETDQSAEDPEYTRVNITALAAGGTLDLYLHLNPGSTKNIFGDISSDGTHTLLPHGVTEVANAEWHKWFGNFPSSKMINTNATGGAWSTTRSTCQVLIEGSFSLTEYSLAGSNGNIQGFYVTVEGCDLSNIDPTGETSWTLKAKSEEGAAPQMFLILDQGNEDGSVGWKWPIERGHIRYAYEDENGHSFKDWAENKNSTTAQKWHKYPTGSVIDRSKIGTSQTITTDYEWSDFTGS